MREVCHHALMNLSISILSLVGALLSSTVHAGELSCSNKQTIYLSKIKTQPWPAVTYFAEESHSMDIGGFGTLRCNVPGRYVGMILDGHELGLPENDDSGKTVLPFDTTDAQASGRCDDLTNVLRRRAYDSRPVAVFLKETIRNQQCVWVVESYN